MLDFLKNLGKSVKDTGKNVKDKGKHKIMQKMMERQMKDAPPAQREQMQMMFKKNPELFERMGKRIKEKTDKGMSESMAAMRVAQEFKDELRKLQR